MAQITLPISLGPAFWEKQKSALAKAAKAPVTKLGDELKTLAKLHLGIDWAAVGDDKLDSVDQAHARMSQLEDAARGKIKALAEQAQAIETAALKFDAEAKKDKQFPKEPLAAASAVAKAAKEFRSEVDDFVARSRKALAARAAALAAQKAKGASATGTGGGAESKAAKLVRARGLDAIRKIKKPVPGAKPLRFVIVQGKTTVATYLGPAVGPAQEVLLKGLIPGEAPYKTFKDLHGVLAWEKNAVTFVSDVLPAGLVKKMQLWLKKILKLNLRLRVRKTSGEVEETEGEDIQDDLLAPDPAEMADRSQAGHDFQQRLAKLQPDIKRAMSGASAEQIRELLASIGQHGKTGAYEEADAELDEIEALLEQGVDADAGTGARGATADAEPVSPDAMTSWKTRRAAAVTALKAVAAQIAETRHASSARAIIEIQAVVKNLTPEPASLQQVTELQRYLATDDVVTDVCELAEDIRAPLLDALAELRAKLVA